MSVFGEFSSCMFNVDVTMIAFREARAHFKHQPRSHEKLYARAQN